MRSFRIVFGWAFWVIVALLIVLLYGCKTVGRIKSGGTIVAGVVDAGKAATLATGESKQSVAIPAETPVSVTRIEAVPATDKTPFEPAREVFSFTPAKETRWEAVSSTLRADTGTVDTSIAMKRIEAAETRYLLFASLGAAMAGGLFVYIKYPTPALMCGAASVVFFLAWKLSDLPDWFYVIGVVAAVGGIIMWKAHDRGEKDAANPPIP